ncbi:hypothetical protein AB1Y20_016620 [Prymnesium parvum]|uniref:Uncharacterized protein n=1 Tax=Prymnesium parvum TaxID=97485 RepID=A0AB34ID54_PRYPA
MKAQGGVVARPEMLEIKNTIKNLKKEAEMRLTLDVEAQQSFDFLSDQVHGLRRAFSTLSDVLIEEVDLIRSEVSDHRQELLKRTDILSRTVKSAKAEAAMLHNEAFTSSSSSKSRLCTLEERMEMLQDDLAVLAQEVSKGSSAQHLLQLEVVQLRSQMDEEARERRVQHEATSSTLRQILERFEAHQQETRASKQELDSSFASMRDHVEQHLTAHSAAIDSNRTKALQSSQTIEKLWAASKQQQQRVEAVATNASLQYQQLQERLETVNKQHMRWRGTQEEAVIAVAADVQLLQTQGRTMETAISSSKAEARRLLSEHEGEIQRQCDALGRAIHSLAETLNLPPPVVATPTRSPAVGAFSDISRSR